jgi:hypothetical protein
MLFFSAVNFFQFWSSETRIWIRIRIETLRIRNTAAGYMQLSIKYNVCLQIKRHLSYIRETVANTEAILLRAKRSLG